MTSTGFTATIFYASVWEFQLARLDAPLIIQFHEPHPRGKLPFRLARLYRRMLKLNRAYS